MFLKYAVTIYISQFMFWKKYVYNSVNLNCSVKKESRYKYIIYSLLNIIFIICNIIFLHLLKGVK